MAGGKAGGVDVVHHHPPRDMVADVGYPVRGGQTLLIAYFPWEASEADIEREFSKFCQVKRVHLVIDKSSRKPRCFGFVKFMSKADAEEALRATTQGLVQLPDTRGHVWHLKAEWTKSGDMVVDDSETEQEVAKRKEERRYRVDARDEDGTHNSGLAGGGGGAQSGKHVSGPGASHHLKGALHPGVPAPLPPLQARTVAMGMGYGQHVQNAGLGLQMPMMQPGQGCGHPGQLHLPQAQHGLHQGPGVAQQALYGNIMQQGLPMYNGQAYPGGPPLYGGLPRDVVGGLPPPAQAYQPGYPGGQSPYGAGQQATYAASQQYSGQGSAIPSPYPNTAQHPGYAGQPPVSYPPHPQSYPPQAAAAQQGYGPPPPGYPPPGAGYQTSPSSYAGAQLTGYPQNPYGYLQQHNGLGIPPPGVYGGYPGGPTAATLHPHALMHPMDEASQAAHAANQAIAANQMHHNAAVSGVHSLGLGAAVTMPYAALCGGAVLVPERAAGTMLMTGPMAAPTLGGVGDASQQHFANRAGAEAAAAQPQHGVMGSQNQSLDMMWHLPHEIPLHDKSLPAPPAQQPPAPPAHHTATAQWSAEAFPPASAHPVAATGPTATLPMPAGGAADWGASRPAGSPPAAVWNSFDDAAAKGMVDGLVGREDGPAPTSTWGATHHAVG